MKVDGELNDSFAVRVGMRQACVMSTWLFHIFMDGCIREMKAEVGKRGARLKLNGVHYSMAVSICR